MAVELVKRTVHFAAARREVGVLDEMETICAEPVAETWVSLGLESRSSRRLREVLKARGCR